MPLLELGGAAATAHFLVGSIIKFRDGNELAQRHYAVIVAADGISYSLVIDSVPGRVAVVPAASADTYFEGALVGVVSVRVADDPVNRACVYESDVMIEFTLRLTSGSSKLVRVPKTASLARRRARRPVLRGRQSPMRSPLAPSSGLEKLSTCHSSRTARPSVQLGLRQLSATAPRP